MSFQKNRKMNKAFTLYELTITIALFTLVAGLVISFITIMSNFSAKNEKIGARIQQVAKVRNEIDYWFSFFDQPDCTYEIVNDSKSGLCVRAVDRFGAEYGLYLSLRVRPNSSQTSDDAYMQALTAQYPVDAAHGNVVEYTRPDGVQLTMRETVVFGADVQDFRCYESNDSWNRNQEDEADIRFLVKTHVSGRVFAFVIDFAY